MKIFLFIVAFFSNLLLVGVSFAETSSSSTASFQLTGEWQQGGVIIGKLVGVNETGISKIEFAGRQLRISSSGQFVLGLGRDAPPTVKLIITDQQKKSVEHLFQVKQRKYQIQKVTGVPQQTVTPNPEQVERAKREAKMAANARKGNLDLDFFAQPFVWPLIGPVTGVYGSQRIYNGVPNSPHYGVDVARPVGAEVTAPAGGLVTLVHPDMFFSGGTLIIDHGHGLSSTFIHLSEILVKEGDTIKQGQAIAKVGKTGRATGPHLDWRMNWFEERIDPQLLVPPMPE
jgi:murein DD-endopeptidase MepM/ murein hydrolase activator NlpD